MKLNLKEEIQETVNILLVLGVEGHSIYINDFRVAGNKPWGGGETVREWTIPKKDIVKALDRPDPRPKDI